MTNVFCDLARVRSVSPISPGFTAFDGMIQDQIIGASDMIRKFCRRNFDKQTYTQYLPSFAYAMFEARLKEHPIVTGSVAVDYDVTGRFIYPYTLIEGTDFIVDYDNGKITFLGDFQNSQRGMRVVYTGGYDVLAGIVQVPGTVAIATSMQAAYTLRRIRTAAMGEQQQEKGRQQLQTFTVSGSSGLLAEVEGMVIQYRIPLVGRT